jgi:hypothetical protein
VQVKKSTRTGSMPGRTPASIPSSGAGQHAAGFVPL